LDKLSISKGYGLKDKILPGPQTLFFL
jgi:hypothetical protein